MGKTQKKLSTHKRRSLKKRNKGGNLLVDLAGSALGASHLRSVYYVDWLEERLLLHFKDMNWLQSTRKKFAYDKTSARPFPQGILTKYCGRKPEDKQAISPAFAQAQCPLNINKVLNKGARVGVGAAAAAQKVVNNKGVVANNMQQQPFQNRNRKPFQQPQPQPKQPQPSF